VSALFYGEPTADTAADEIALRRDAVNPTPEDSRR